MKQLLASVDRNRWLSVTSVSCEGRDLLIRFAFVPEPTDGTPPVWFVSCRQVREFSLSDFEGGGLNWWRTRHPLLSLFSSPKASLTVRTGRRYAECLGVLLQAHQEAVKDWIEFDPSPRRAVVTMNRSDPMAIAGPEFLIKAYRSALDAAGYDARLKKHKRALYWNGVGWSRQRQKVSLMHFGDSFVVAESFSAAPDSGRGAASNQRLDRSRPQR